jgi:hypothetical protein
MTRTAIKDPLNNNVCTGEFSRKDGMDAPGPSVKMIRRILITVKIQKPVPVIWRMIPEDFLS